MNPQQLFHSDGKPSRVWYCGKCRMTAHDEAMATRCCNPVCDVCGNPCSVYSSLCEGCQSKKRAEHEASLRAKATVLDSWDGWIYAEGYGYTDGYFNSIEDLLEYMEDVDDDLEWPQYAYVCEPEQIATIDAGSIYDSFEWPDGMDLHDLNGTKEFEAAVDAFNEANKDVLCYVADMNRIVLIPARSEQKP
jgi:hypothetical protein